MIDRRQVRSRGFSLVESVIATLIAGLLLVAAMGTVHAAKVTQLTLALRGRAAAMAQAMMNEVLALPYADPNQPAVFGLESGETGATRALFDDVDDYAGLDESPPADRGGASMDASAVGGVSRWRRRVTVEWVDPANFAAVSNAETGVKQVKVEVLYAGKSLVTLVSIKGNYP